MYKGFECLKFMKSVVIYIICHDDVSYEKALEIKHEIETNLVTAHIIKLGASIFFENVAFRYIQTRFDEWKDATFVGLLSYNIKNKVQYIINVDQIINDVTDDIDVISFYNITFSSSQRHGVLDITIYDTLRIFHGNNSMIAWYTLLSANGIPYNEIQRKVANSFYCNSFLARPCAMLEYITFNISCQDIFNNQPNVRHALLQEVAYDRPLRCQELGEIKKYGVDHWVCVPFVFERLAPWFFSNEKYKTKFVFRNMLKVSDNVFDLIRYHSSTK